jgi:hypothetical protein
MTFYGCMEWSHGQIMAEKSRGPGWNSYSIVERNEASFYKPTIIVRALGYVCSGIKSWRIFYMERIEKFLELKDNAQLESISISVLYPTDNNTFRFENIDTIYSVKNTLGETGFILQSQNGTEKLGFFNDSALDLKTKVRVFHRKKRIL